MQKWVGLGLVLFFVYEVFTLIETVILGQEFIKVTSRLPKFRCFSHV